MAGRWPNWRVLDLTGVSGCICATWAWSSLLEHATYSQEGHAILSRHREEAVQLDGGAGLERKGMRSAIGSYNQAVPSPEMRGTTQS